MPTVLVTGSNRGIGFGLVREYVARGWSVIAACRTPAKAAALNALAEKSDLEVAPLDVGRRHADPVSKPRFCVDGPSTSS